jgi:hypothetical protein
VARIIATYTQGRIAPPVFVWDQPIPGTRAGLTRRNEPKGATVREYKEENRNDGKPRRGRWSRAEVARLEELYGLRDDGSIARELNRPLPSVRKMAEKIFPLVEREGAWSPEEVERLKKYLGASKASVIARILGRSQHEVEERIAELGAVQNDRPWTRDEIARFKRIYGTRTDSDLVAVFGRPIEVIRALALKHALAKDKTFRRKLEGESATRMPRWYPQEVELLRELYPSEPNLEIARRLSRTVKSVVSKAHNLNLKKSNERLQRMGRENVSLRYQEEPSQAAAPPERVVELPVTPPRVEPVPTSIPEPELAREPEVEIPRPPQPRVDAHASERPEDLRRDGPDPQGGDRA